MEQTMACIGPRDEMLPFRALGARVFITEDIEEAREALLRFAVDRHPIILISDDLLRWLDDTAEQINLTTGSAVTSLPGKKGTAEFSREQIQEHIKKAIGINIDTTGGEE